MKTYVIIISEYFPKGNSEAGKPTGFPLAIKHYEKLHTIRGNYSLWKKRFVEINAGKAILSIRIWSGKPYQSKQLELFTYDHTHKIGVQSLQMTQLGWFVDGKDSDFTLADFAKNDGLSFLQFSEWFRGKISIDMEPMAIIHFTDFRY